MILEQLNKTYPSDIKIAKLQKAIDVQDQIRFIEKLIEMRIDEINRWDSLFTRNHNEKIAKLQKRKSLLEHGYNLIISEL